MECRKQEKAMIMKNNFLLEQTGIVYTAQGDAEILHWTTHYLKVVVHFYHSDFKHCQIVDHHFKVVM